MKINDIIGNYLIEGANQNEEGSKYRGSLTLTIRAKGGIHAVWKIEPDQMQYGVGFFNNNMLVINFYYKGDNEVVFKGVVAYTCNSNGTLDGIWSEEIGDSKYVGLEKAHKLKNDYLN